MRSKDVSVNFQMLPLPGLKLLGSGTIIPPVVPRSSHAPANILLFSNFGLSSILLVQLKVTPISVTRTTIILYRFMKNIICQDDSSQLKNVAPGAKKCNQNYLHQKDRDSYYATCK